MVSAARTGSTCRPWGATSIWRSCCTTWICSASQSISPVCTPADLTDLHPALVQTEAVLLPWRTLRQQAKARLAEEEYQAMLAHELELERLQQGVLLQTLRGLSLFRGKSHNLLNYLSLLGAQQGPLRDLIC